MLKYFEGGKSLKRPNRTTIAIFCTIALLLLTISLYLGYKRNSIKAIYLTPKSGGKIVYSELTKYPEVAIVKSASTLKLKRFLFPNAAIWVDKDAISLIGSDWFVTQSEKHIPIVVIGYNNPTYSFTKAIPGLGIHPPNIDWSQQSLEPGFSVWRLKEGNDATATAFMKGYKSVPTANEVLKITNLILNGEYPD